MKKLPILFIAGLILIAVTVIPLLTEGFSLDKMNYYLILMPIGFALVMLSGSIAIKKFVRGLERE